jgi:hypothetical protein
MDTEPLEDLIAPPDEKYLEEETITESGDELSDITNEPQN